MSFQRRERHEASSVCLKKRWQMPFTSSRPLRWIVGGGQLTACCVTDKKSVAPHIQAVHLWLIWARLCRVCPLTKQLPVSILSRGSGILLSTTQKEEAHFNAHTHTHMLRSSKHDNARMTEATGDELSKAQLLTRSSKKSESSAHRGGSKSIPFPGCVCTESCVTPLPRLFLAAGRSHRNNDTKSRWLFRKHVLSQVTTQSSGPQPYVAASACQMRSRITIYWRKHQFSNVRRRWVKCVGAEQREKIKNVVDFWLREGKINDASLTQ